MPRICLCNVQPVPSLYTRVATGVCVCLSVSVCLSVLSLPLSLSLSLSVHVCEYKQTFEGVYAKWNKYFSVSGFRV